jgi:hypothetical protein
LLPAALVWPVTGTKEYHVKRVVLSAAAIAALATASPALADDVLNGQLNLLALQTGTVNLKSVHMSDASATAAAAGNAISVTDTQSGGGLFTHDDVLNLQANVLSKQIATINANWSDLDQGTSLTAQAVGNQTTIDHTTTFPKGNSDGSLITFNIDQSNSQDTTGVQTAVGVGIDGGDGSATDTQAITATQSNIVNLGGLADYLKNLGKNDYVTLQANVLASQNATINANSSWINGTVANPVSLTAAAFGNSIAITHTTK